MNTYMSQRGRQGSAVRNNNEGLLGNFLKEYGFLVKGKNMNQDG